MDAKSKFARKKQSKSKKKGLTSSKQKAKKKDALAKKKNNQSKKNRAKNKRVLHERNHAKKKNSLCRFLKAFIGKADDIIFETGVMDIVEMLNCESTNA